MLVSSIQENISENTTQKMTVAKELTFPALQLKASFSVTSSTQTAWHDEARTEDARMVEENSLGQRTNSLRGKTDETGGHPPARDTKSNTACVK